MINECIILMWITVTVLTKMQICTLFGVTIFCILGPEEIKLAMSAIGGSKNAATFAFGSKLSLWAKKFQKVYLIDNSSSGIYQNMSDNLLDIIK